jgi:hypothetical protein
VDVVAELKVGQDIVFKSQVMTCSNEERIAIVND